MILSHKYRFIFLKTTKSAGTSIEIALSKFCGEEDLITPILPEDEKIRAELGYRGPQNYLAPIGDYSVKDIAKWILRAEKKKRFYNHMPAVEIKKYIDESIWNQYFKFCFVRNPWDRMISFYYWYYRDGNLPPFSVVFKPKIIKRLHRGGKNIYLINEEIAVDRVCRYENLSHELEEISAIIGLPEVPVLPKAKGSYRKDKRPYTEVLSQEDQEKIGAVFQTEIDLFGYE